MKTTRDTLFDIIDKARKHLADADAVVNSNVDDTTKLAATRRAIRRISRLVRVNELDDITSEDE